MGLIEKWYNFFKDLEDYHQLNVDNPVHIWLLHHLFLGALNEEAQRWAAAWNCHKIRTEGNRTPREIFLFDMVEKGTRGIGWMEIRPGQLKEFGVEWRFLNQGGQPNAADDTWLEEGVMPDQYQEYGIDWDALNQRGNRNVVEGLMREDGGDDVMQIEVPQHMNEVQFDVPASPLSAEQMAALDAHLWRMFGASALDMSTHQRKGLWSAALHMITNLPGQ